MVALKKMSVPRRSSKPEVLPRPPSLSRKLSTDNYLVPLDLSKLPPPPKMLSSLSTTDDLPPPPPVYSSGETTPPVDYDLPEADFLPPPPILNEEIPQIPQMPMNPPMPQSLMLSSRSSSEEQTLSSASLRMLTRPLSNEGKYISDERMRRREYNKVCSR